jgi:hypothetical protein
VVGREEKHVLINHQLDDGGIGRGVTTTELQPLSKVMQASSRSRCKRRITLIGGRRWDSDINGSVTREGGRGGVALVVGVKEKACVGWAGGEGIRDEVEGFGGDGVVGDGKTSKGGKFRAWFLSVTMSPPEAILQNTRLMKTEQLGCSKNTDVVF